MINPVGGLLKTPQSRRDNQKRSRRRDTLMRKAFEYYEECDADVYLALRMRKTGQIYTVASKSNDWPPSLESLVCVDAFLGPVSYTDGQRARSTPNQSILQWKSCLLSTAGGCRGSVCQGDSFSERLDTVSMSGSDLLPLMSCDARCLYVYPVVSSVLVLFLLPSCWLFSYRAT